MIVTRGATVSPLPRVYESILDAILVFPAASENTPVHTDTVIVPVDTVGVTVTVYPVELFATNPPVTPPVTERLLMVRSVVGSEVTRLIVIAHVIARAAVEESITVGRVVSNTPVSTIPDATTWVVIPPE